LTDEVLPGILTDEVLPGILTDEVLPCILTDEVLPGILTDEVHMIVKISGRTSSFLYKHDGQNIWQNFVISV
jgi:hypothetical protein